MEFIPQLQIGLLNGWIFLAVHVLIQCIVSLTCPKEVRSRLIDRKSWTKTQRIVTVIGKSFSLINIILIIFSPLKIDSIEFIVGIIMFVIGLTGMCVAVINFKNAPLDKPITTGSYRISRNPQMFSIYILFLGYCFLIGSWISIILLIGSIIGAHFSILGEEKRLSEQYGESYLEYKKKVARYFLVF